VLRSFGVDVIVLAAQAAPPSGDTDVFAYAVAGVLLLVIGCMLSIFATARRTAVRSARSQSVARAAPTTATSASVARLLHDVSGWTKRP
jgi:uncharacterized membrane protein